MTLYLIYDSTTGVGQYVTSSVPYGQTYVAITEEFYQSCNSTPSFITVVNGEATLNFSYYKYSKQQEVNALFNTIKVVKITDSDYVVYGWMSNLSIYALAYEQYTDSFPMLCTNATNTTTYYKNFTDKAILITMLQKLSKLYIETEKAKFEINTALNNAQTMDDLEAINLTLPAQDISE